MTKLIFIALCFVATSAHAFPMKLEWDPVTKMTDGSPALNVRYRLYRRNKVPNNSQWFRVTETYNTFYTAQILQFGSFVYRVTAFNTSGESVPSNELPIRVELCAKEEL